MKTILIIEDEQQLIQAYQEKLKTEYQLKIVSTIGAALREITKDNINLIVLDIMLPGGENGFDLLQRLQQGPETKNIPVLVVTNLGENERKTALELGAREYLIKANISLDDLIRTIKSYLQ